MNVQLSQLEQDVQAMDAQDRAEGKRHCLLSAGNNQRDLMRNHDRAARVQLRRHQGRNSMMKHTQVRILSDDWSSFNKIATVIGPEPVPGSSQVWLDVDGVKVVVAFHEVAPCAINANAAHR